MDNDFIFCYNINKFKYYGEKNDKINRFFGINKEDYKHYKMHFAIGGIIKEEAKEIFYADNFNEWQTEQTKKNFNRQYVIFLIWLKDDKWMFGGAHEIMGDPIAIIKNGWHGNKYPMKQLNIQQDMIGRAIVKYKKEFRASYLALELVPSNGQGPAEIEISEISEEKISVEDFLGFDKVNINYSILKVIIDKNIPSWKNALSKTKGVYLIVDTKTGKQYIGSAYGDECIWSR